LSRLIGLLTEDIFGWSASMAAAKTLEAVVVYPRQILPQQRGRKFVRLQNCGAKPGTGPAKKSENRSAVLQRVKPIHLGCDRQHC
jgi:hypothetical protein